MSFSLPRNQRDLRFSGQLRAAIEEDGPKLGMRRRRQAPSIPADVYDADPIPTPYFGQPSPLDEDDDPTTMIDRDAALAPKTKVIPGFRKPAASDSGTPSVIVSLPPIVTPKRKASGPPLAFWLVAAVVLGFASYRIAPVALSHAKAVTGFLDSASDP